MSQGLREFDDSRGRCCHCSKLIFKGETWCIPDIRGEEVILAHSDCNREYMAKASQI